MTGVPSPCKCGHSYEKHLGYVGVSSDPCAGGTPGFCGCTGYEPTDVSMSQSSGHDDVRGQLDRAAILAVGDMAADSWCPKQVDVQRVQCRYCIAEVVRDALLPLVSRISDRRTADALRAAADWLPSAPDTTSSGTSWDLDVEGENDTDAAMKWVMESLTDRGADLAPPHAGEPS